MFHVFLLLIVIVSISRILHEIRIQVSLTLRYRIEIVGLRHADVALASDDHRIVVLPVSAGNALLTPHIDVRSVVSGNGLTAFL